MSNQSIYLNSKLNNLKISLDESISNLKQFKDMFKDDEQSIEKKIIRVENTLRELGYYVCTECKNYRPVGLYWTPSCCSPQNEHNNVERSPVTGEYPVPCADMRRPYEACGPEGKLFDWKNIEDKYEVIKKMDVFFESHLNSFRSAKNRLDEAEEEVFNIKQQIQDIEWKIRYEKQEIEEKNAANWFYRFWSYLKQKRIV